MRARSHMHTVFHTQEYMRWLCVHIFYPYYMLMLTCGYDRPPSNHHTSGHTTAGAMPWPRGRDCFRLFAHHARRMRQVGNFTSGVPAACGAVWCVCGNQYHANCVRGTHLCIQMRARFSSKYAYANFGFRFSRSICGA